MKDILYVVPIIDTEGPTTGHPEMIDSWEELEKVIQLLDGDVRNSMRDSFGNPLIINWFLLDWTGYSKNDAEFKRRGHDIRLHAVWDFYKSKFLHKNRIKETQDGLYWHYHHPPLDGSWGWNKNWNDSNWYEYILGKLILNHDFFPSVYRAGKYVQTNESSEWLEKWIPFDYSSISPVKRDFCDWSEATLDWLPYNPHVENYQKQGNMRRYVARSLPVAAKGGSGTLSVSEIEKAFDDVKNGRGAIFSFHTHDYYKSINDEFKNAHQMIDEVGRKKGVKWKYSNSLNALRNFIQNPLEKLTMKMTQKAKKEIEVVFNHEIFCHEPFVVIENESGEVKRLSPTKISPLKFTFKLERDTERYGVGANDYYGNVAVSSKII